jgi:GGDEF domain-containing protein
MTASIGVAVYQADGQNCNDFIKHADIAMYLAKLAKRPAQQLNSNGHT